MGATAAGRRRGPGGEAVAIGVVAALLAHAIVLGGVSQLELGDPDGDAVRAAARADAEATALAAATPLEPSCDGDAVLRAAARAALCLTPLGEQSTDVCLDQVAARLDTDFLLCHIDTLEMLPPVSLVSVRHAEALPSIDAEPLLEPLTPEEQQQFEEQLAAQVAAAPPPPPPPPDKQQVVEVAKPATEEAPDQADYLSEYDSKADKQEVARGATAEDMVAKPDPAEVAARKDAVDKATQPDEVEDVGKPEAPVSPGALSMRRPGAPAAEETPQERKDAGDSSGRDAPDGDGAARKRGDGSVSQDERKPTEVARKDGDGGGGGGKPEAPKLRPDDEELERMVGGGNVDHVDDVEEGDETALNSKRWVYASFFNRLKRMVAQVWNPAAVWRREDPDGSHFGFKSRNTQLRVSLDTRGEVQKIVVIGPCGVDALDDEAIRAFRAAQPFPNPPQALVDNNGLITFDFGFYFTINSSSTSWKVRRGN